MLALYVLYLHINWNKVHQKHMNNDYEYFCFCLYFLNFSLLSICNYFYSPFFNYFIIRKKNLFEEERRKPAPLDVP